MSKWAEEADPLMVAGKQKETEGSQDSNTLSGLRPQEGTTMAIL